MNAEFVTVCMADGADFEGFRAAVRRLIAAGAPPDRVAWRSGPQASLFAGQIGEAAAPLMLSKGAAELARTVACHSDPERYALLYRLIWRIRRGEKDLLEIASDPLIHRLQGLAKDVRRDLHKMHAFVRFRRVEDKGVERWIAWFEPDHFIVEATSGFFVNRFRGMDWAILTPKGSLHWDRKILAVGPPTSRGALPDRDEFEAHWRDYYESTFNPARLNTALMRKEMPTRYWRNLPEAQDITRLSREAPARVAAMVAHDAEALRKRDPLKAVAAMQQQGPATLDALNRTISEARPPPGFSPRAVLGEGPAGASMAIIGEQPGDQEDLQGRPFVGPAGELLDRALAEAGVPRDALYVTNAVKHFKHELRGKRRIHQSPTSGEVKHYRWWLMQELDFVRPRLVLTLGNTAALAMAARPLPVTANRGPARFEDRLGYITVHPAYLLRLPDEALRARAHGEFVQDLARAWALAGGAMRGAA